MRTNTLSLAKEEARSLRALTERPACFEIDPRRRAVKRAYRIWVSAAAHHCEQRRIDLLFTMSDNLHRAIEDRRDTNSWVMDELCLVSRLPVRLRFATARQPSRTVLACRAEAPVGREGWWSQTGSNRRPPACKAGALPTELWPRLRNATRLKWWAWEDLNFRPHAYQARALTN